MKKFLRITKETGYIIHSGGRLRFALVYPNFYYVGMSNLGLHIIYQLLNLRDDTACERFFLDEPLSVETQTPLQKFDVIGFAVSFEQDYFNVVKMLQAAKINPRAAERTKFDPILIAGGPCATFNPAPLSGIFDAFVIGEGEVILPPMIDVLAERLSRLETLKELAKIPGVYVPSVAQEKVSRQWLKNLDSFPAHSVIITNDTEFNMYLIETARGCGHHCRFCMAGYCFRRPRNRSLEVLKAEVQEAVKFGKKIGLMGAAISDYPQIDELCRFILDAGLEMSVASFRADSVTPDLVKALVASGLKTLTIAPEVGSEKMRAVVNKNITEENVFRAVELGLAAGVRNFKLYFMIGLPFEEMSDVEAIADLSQRLKKFVDGKLTLSVNPFVPKPFTPFQWAKFADRKYLNAALKILRERLKKIRGVEVLSESIKSSEVQAILSRGDRRIAEFLLQSDSPQKFLQVLRDAEVDTEFYLRRERPAEEIFSWDILDMGFGKKYLRAEFERAAALKPTAACFDGCRRCGVCL